MEVADLASIKRKSIVGVMALTTRTFFLGIIAFVANQLLLPLFLDPDVYGIYIVVSAVIAFLGYFSDIGLAASLIQKKDALTQEDIVTTFSIQQLLVGSSVLIALFFSSNIAQFYNLNESGLWLLKAIILSFFISSLKTIPSILLERKLAFEKLIIPTIVESLVFYFIVVLLAWRGFGLASFSIAVLMRGIVGLIAIYSIEPWRIRFGISGSSAKSLLKFGIPFQANSFLALLKDDLMTLYLGRVLPFAEIGYIGWAKKFAEVPLRLFMDNVIRITFPAFSRLQHDKETLGRAIDKTIYGLSISTLPIFCFLIFFIRQMVYLVPRYSKWEQALPSFYIFVFVSIIACLNTPLTNALNAIGKVKITLGFMIAYVVLTWVSTVLLLPLFGFIGFAMALSIISLTIFPMIIIAKKYFQFSFISHVWTGFVSIAVQALVYAFLIPFAGVNVIGLISSGVIGVIVYMAVLFSIDRTRLTLFVLSIVKK